MGWALQVAIALKGAVYLWNASTGSIETVRSVAHFLHSSCTAAHFAQLPNAFHASQCLHMVSGHSSLLPKSLLYMRLAAHARILASYAATRM